MYLSSIIVIIVGGRDCISTRASVSDGSHDPAPAPAWLVLVLVQSGPKIMRAGRVIAGPRGTAPPLASTQGEIS